MQLNKDMIHRNKDSVVYNSTFTVSTNENVLRLTSFQANIFQKSNHLDVLYNGMYQIKHLASNNSVNQILFPLVTQRIVLLYSENRNMHCILYFQCCIEIHLYIFIFEILNKNKKGKFIKYQLLLFFFISLIPFRQDRDNVFFFDSVLSGVLSVYILIIHISFLKQYTHIFFGLPFFPTTIYLRT